VESPNLAQRLCLRRRYSRESGDHFLNSIILSSGPSGVTFWKGTRYKYEARNTGLMDLLLCQPPATKIRATYREPRMKGPSRPVEMEIQRDSAVRFGDVVAAAEK